MMKPINYFYIIAFISFTVLATLGLQLYWNIKNYQENKALLIQDVKSALDSGVDNYFIKESKENFFAFVKDNDSISDDSFFENLRIDTLFNKKSAKFPQKNQAEKGNLIDQLTKLKKEKSDNSKGYPNSIDSSINISSIKVFRGQKSGDSLSATNKDVVSLLITQYSDSINLQSLDSLLSYELKRKNIQIDYVFEVFKLDRILQKSNFKNSVELPLSTFSTSTYLRKNQKIELHFSNPQKLILKRSSVEILLSLLLSLSTIFCILFLLKIIKRQKVIDVVKNDLISNITHEFKTPITTISTAIEGIRNFNDKNDKEKTNIYLAISDQQLSKLGLMVERLLETASLNTENLGLKLESTDVGALINLVIEKHKMSTIKEIVFTINFENQRVMLDPFHFENVISNIIDNAIKYGGENITITVCAVAKDVEIVIIDNGHGIEKSERSKIFEQFYRIPQGNIHNVKGFGIGLFYSKKIIEKHKGKLELLTTDKLTSFKITLPYA